MADPYIGEIRMFGGNFAPRDWAFCDGQLLSIADNQALFSLLGTTYGGNGQTTFALPDLRGRIPVHQGQGPGLSPVSMGQKWGAETVPLQADQIPTHTHSLMASGATATTPAPGPNVVAGTPAQTLYSPDMTTADEVPTESIRPAGGNRGHTNLMPTLCVNFIICLFGLYPQRN